MSAASYKRMIEKKPYLVSWRNARRRCIDPNHTTYKFYGGKGVKFRLSKEECSYLWERDCAWLLQDPQLDRLDEDGDYCLDNCQFISKLDNLARRRFKSKGNINEIKKECKTEWTD